MPSTSHQARRRRVRSTGCALAIGVLASIAAASAASAHAPYEPDESAEQGDYPDQPGTPDPPSGGGGSTSSAGTTVDIPVLTGGGTQATVPAGSSWDEDLGTDLVKLTDPGIDLGDGNWVGILNDPAGPGSVQWSIDGGLFSARVVGTLHLDDVSGQSGRVHVSYWNYGELVETRHSMTRRAPDDGHHQWSVNLPNLTDIHITEVHVCTEISDDGVDFDSVSCKTRFI